MIIDQQNEFSSDQALTVTAPSTNIIDLSEFREIAEGEAMGILISVGVAADFTTGDESYQVVLQTDDNIPFGSPTTVMSQVLTAAQLALGAHIFLPISNLVLMEQYLRLNFVLGGTTPSVTLSAALQPKAMVDEFRTYKNNYTIVGH